MFLHANTVTVTSWDSHTISSRPRMAMDEYFPIVVTCVSDRMVLPETAKKWMSDTYFCSGSSGRVLSFHRTDGLSCWYTTTFSDFRSIDVVYLISITWYAYACLFMSDTDS